MSVRIKKSSNITTPVNDHNQLLNSGTRTHQEIDEYLADLDNVKGIDPDINTRITRIEQTANTTKSEVEQARTDANGVAYNSLKERLDALQTSGGGGGLSSNYLYEVFVNPTQGTTQINLTSGSYTPGIAEIEVFRNGLRQTLDVDYVETDEFTITLTQPLETGEIVVLRIRDRSELAPLGFNTYYFILNSPESIFTVPEEFSIDGRNLEVYCNGVLQTLGEDYIIKDSRTIELVEPALTGSLVYFQVGDKTLNYPPKLLQELITLNSNTKLYTLNKFTYNVGKKELELWLNGLRLVEGIDYSEIDEKSFQLFEFPPDGSELLAVKENGITASGAGESEVVLDPYTQFQGMFYVYDVPPGAPETDIITLPTSYVLGQNELLVFFNGTVVSFTEIDETTIKLPITLLEGDQVVVYKTNKFAVKLDKMLSRKVNGITVEGNTTKVIEISVASSAIDIRYLAINSLNPMDALFEIIESPSETFELFLLNSVNQSRINFSGSQPYVDDTNMSKVYMKVTNRGVSSIEFNINLKYVLYST